LTSAGQVLGAMAGLHGIEAPGRLVSVLGTSFALLVGALLVFVNVSPNTWQVRLVPTVRSGLAFGLALGGAVLAITAASPFLYYQF
jgi:hypothetical protein